MREWLGYWRRPWATGNEEGNEEGKWAGKCPGRNSGTPSALWNPACVYTQCGFISRVTVLPGLPGRVSVCFCCPTTVTICFFPSRISDLDNKLYGYFICNLISQILVSCQYRRLYFSKSEIFFMSHLPLEKICTPMFTAVLFTINS